MKTDYTILLIINGGLSFDFAKPGRNVQLISVLNMVSMPSILMLFVLFGVCSRAEFNGSKKKTQDHV